MPEHIEKIPPEAIIRMLCAWRGCDRECFVGNILPAGWKCIVVGDTIDTRFANVDGVLCPEHFKELFALLKVSQFKTAE